MTSRDGFSDAWDEDDEESVSFGPGDESGLDAMPTYAESFRTSGASDVGASGLWTYDESLDDDPMVDTLTVTATNPTGTVSATALLDGRVMEIGLLPQVTKLTEGELAAEIAAVARLAGQQGKAAQHAFIAMFMRQLGHDGAALRSFLERNVGLPSPETVLQEKSAAFFAARNAGDG